ncbi:MAG: transglutaminase domain-containing protein [Fimbriimonadaceae bacterium]|jgi:transglutaminase-like putative cysteine protease|nr:transglutaminase domain-containing protein [Fimbriimonadaceae bacterium]
MKFSPHRTFLDHLLAIMGGVMATYAIAASLTKMTLALTLAGAALFAGIIGYFISTKLKDSKVIQYDGWVCAVLCLSAVFATRTINSILPEEGFPFQLFAATVLSMLVIAGNLAAWRDATLLFPSLPALALFGLVGTFDTYRPGTILFFAFLICVAVLYARVHQRVMMERVQRLGFDPELLKKDRWRWMAGPGWAFAAAGSIILLSLAGAPVLRQSLSGVSGAVRVSLPNEVQRPPQSPQNASQETQAEQMIGQGPRTQSGAPAFQIRIDQPRLLRTDSYISYGRRGWSSPFSRFPEEAIPWRDNRGFSTGRYGGVQLFPNRVPESEPLKEWEEIQITIVPTGMVFTQLPGPGPVIEYMGSRRAVQRTRTGEVLYQATETVMSPMQFYAAVPLGEPTTSILPPPLQGLARPLRQTDRVTERVRDLALEVTKDAMTDYEKALAITRYVAANTKYNLQAPAVPFGNDPVDHFLFESQEGYCDLYGSSVALMARAVGLHSRYTIGWLIQPTQRNNDGTYTVRMRDFHAWAEIYFEDHGWVAFDATEGAQDISPEPNSAARPLWENEWFVTTITALGVGLGLVLAFFGLRSLISKIQPRGDKVMLDFHRSQTKFQLLIEKKTGHPRRFSQTLREFVEQSSAQLGTASPLAFDLVQQYEEGFFSQNQASPETVAETKVKVKEFAQKLKEKTPL